MQQCHHNDVVGLSNRYLKDTQNDVTFDENIFNECLDELCDLLKPHFDGPISLSDFMAMKSGKLGNRYRKAANDLKDGFDFTKDFDIKAFIKNEKYAELKPPRMIMGRDPKFNLIYGLFTTALEKAMMKIPQFSKGLNFKQMGKQFLDLIGITGWILEGDFEKFESTQRIKLLYKVQMGIWSRLLDKNQELLMFVLFCCLMKKNGTTPSGTKFYFEGCRGSGDMDTGLFNSIICWICCRYFEKVNKTGNGNFICQGDDNGLHIPTGMDNYVDTFSLFGLTAKLILRKDYHDFDYCSGKFMFINKEECVYFQNIVKMMNNIGVLTNVEFEKYAQQYYHSLGYMYKIMYGNCILFSQFADFLMNSTKGQHIDMRILEKINPAVTESFRNTEIPLDVDNAFFLSEIFMSFDIGPAEIDSLVLWLTHHHIHFDAGTDKKMRKFGMQLPLTVDLKMIEADLVHSFECYQLTDISISIMDQIVLSM